MSTCLQAGTHQARSFPPIFNANARILILGSMPGVASLRAEQYYAHQRNLFWPIMGVIVGVDLVSLAYPLRRQALLDAGIALWDVLQSCQRPGSLDADIAADSVVVNDFRELFRACPQIDHVYFNGAAAEQHFRRHVQPAQILPPLQLTRLPSTSPAHAAMNFIDKLAAWRAICEIPGNTGEQRDTT